MSLTKNQKKLYKELVSLCEKNPNFFFVDQSTLVGTQVRIFGYHYASYSDWLEPSALECRGVMFQMQDDSPVELLSRPMEKFFNYAELKAWDKIKGAELALDGDIVSVMIKEDGSLISTFSDNGYLGLKSKTSIKSEQAMDALVSVNQSREFSDRLLELAKDGFTVNMEYVSPRNRIVVGYEEPMVVILNIRNNDTGEYVPYRDILADPILRPYLVELEDVEFSDLDEFAEETYKKTGFEGYVVQTTKGFVKIKTEWYVGLHRTKDTLNSNETLFMCVADNTSDDLKQLFSEDETAIAKIYAFDVAFIEATNRLFALAQQRIEETKGMSRKDYAITLSADTTEDGKVIFDPLMKYYQNTDLQELCDRIVVGIKKNWKLFVPAQYA